MRWVPPGEPAAVGGHVIPGGLIHLGQRPVGSSSPAGPALIDPDLLVAASSGHYVVPGGGPELAYHRLSPVARRAYLDWQAGGRRTEVACGLVLLFCFGLERRVLVDGDEDPAVHRELPAITAEVRRLKARYGDAATSLRETLDRLLDLLELLTARRDTPPPGLGPDRETPIAVGIALARFAVSATAVPAGWAQARIRHHRSLTPRRSENDCPAEFERLFALRYRDRFGAGMVVPAGSGTGIRFRYRPADPGLDTTLVWRADLPDLLTTRHGIGELAALRDEVAAALDPYRRWLARFPQGADSLAAVPLLPAELVDTRHGRLGAVRVWSERRLDGRPRAVVDAGEFRAFWSAADPERMDTDEATALVAVLGRLDLGVEPDVRFGAPPLASGPAVLFRLGRPASGRPGAHFAAAAAIVRCAAAVASAAGPVDPCAPAGVTLLATVTDLAAALRVEPGEDTRLAARFSWHLSTRVEVDRLGRHATVLTAVEREVAGHYLVTVAVTADPAVGPATVSVLTRVYRMLGLDVDLVFERLHRRSTGGSSVLPRLARPDAPPPAATGAGATGTEDPHGPVVVQAAVRRSSGYALPWAAPAEPSSTGIALDHGLVRSKAAESSAASALLSAIFDAEEHSDEASGPDPVPPTAGGDRVIAGLDRAHGALLYALAERPAWTRGEFESLAAAHGVLPDGALDLLNEVAIDTAGDPLIEGDATLAIADDVLRELLA